MKYLISGANGFIGSWLSSRVEQQGDKVIAIPHEMLSDSKVLQTFVKSQKPDVIIAAHAYGNMRGQNEEQDIFKANVLGTWNLLSTSKDVPYKAFINISSSSVYGEKYTPMNETDMLNTRTFYGASKVAGEYFVRAFAHTYQKPIVNIRPFSVYGEGEADFRFIPTVCRSLMTGEAMRVVIAPPHDWIYVDDFCRLTLEVIKHIDVLKGESVNVGTGTQTENWDVIKMLEEISGKKANLTESIEGDNHEWVAGRGVLMDWSLEPKIELYEGLKRCWKYYKEQYGK